MKKLAFLLLCSLLVLASCKNPTAQATVPASDTTTYSVDGSVQKGPFQLGSAITIQTLNAGLEPAGSVFNTLTSDDFGGFSLHSKIPERYVEIQAKGFYFNECAGVTQNAEITLRTYADLSSTNAVHINVLTTIAHQRIKTLVGSGMTFEDAQGKAEKEILDILGLSAVAGMHFSGYNLESNSTDAAILLAISSAFQQDRDVASLQLFLADLAMDLADGSLDDANLVIQIRAGAEAVTPATVIANLQSYYNGRGKTVSIPDFTSARTVLRTAGSTLAKPIPNKSAGTYLSPLEITFTAPVGSIIKYTTNVAIDPATGGTEFIGGKPIAFTASGSTPNNVTIRAVAVLNGVCSAVTTVNYIVREGWIGSDYVDVTPGHYIEYDFSGFLNDGTPVTEKTHAIIQPGSSTVPYFTSIATTNTNWDSCYLFPAQTGYAAGSSGGNNSGNPYAAYFCYVFQQLPCNVYYGGTYRSIHGVTFTPSSIGSWDGFTEVLRVDFDSTNLAYSQFSPYTKTALRGKGYAIYAKGIGLVYFELTHSDTTGKNFGKTETLKYKAKGQAQLVTFRGTLHIAGADPIGYSVSPSTYLNYLPTTAFTTITSGDSFEITQYVVPGCYFRLRFFNSGMTEMRSFMVAVPDSLASIIKLGEIGGVAEGGPITPTP